MGMLGLATKATGPCKPAGHHRDRENDEREESGSGLAPWSQLQHAPAEAQKVPQGDTISILP